MKGSFGGFLRDTWRPAVGAAALGMLVVGCGDSSSNPDAVTVDELKYPGNLMIKDQGNGKADLWWSGANNEKDFDGYNVYGMIGSASDLGVTEGKALELLDDAGEPNAASKAILTKFNYDLTKKLTEKGTATDADAEFEFFPIHGGTAEARLLPTCKVQSGVCDMTTEANKDKTAEDVTYAVNGSVKFTVPDAMVVGSSYCFLVMSSMDQGQKVSQTSSNAECFEPMYSKDDITISLPADTSTHKKLDLAAWLAACNTDGTCSDPTSSTPKYYDTDVSVAHDSSAPLAAYIDYGSSGPAFVAGKNSAVIDLGYYEDGFADTTLPNKAPTLILDTNGILNSGGYSIAGQSVPIEGNHMYVIAVGDSTATGTINSFHYQWIYIDGDVKSAAGVLATTVKIDVRMNKNKH